MQSDLNKMIREFDVCVVGGGLSGVMSAVAAAREGKKTLLIERNGCLGGAATVGLVNPFMNFCLNNPQGLYTRNDMINAGLFQTMMDKLYELGGIKNNPSWHFNEQILKIVLDEMVKKESVNVLFHAMLCGVSVTDDKVESIDVATVSGLLTIKARVFIDASGDAALSALAGVPFELGDTENGLCQPMTTSFNLVNVDWSKVDNAKMNKLYREFKTKGEIKNPRETILKFTLPTKNMMHFNSTRVQGKSPVDAADLSESEMLGREQVYELYRFLKNYVEGFENSEIVAISDDIGIRESRRIKGKYTICEEDVFKLRKFKDSIARCSYDVDMHAQKGQKDTVWKIPYGEYYTIPYRACIPVRFQNLLVAGRCIGSTRIAQASFRIMPVVSCIGEAVGIAGAIASGDSVSVDKINVEKLHVIMDKYNCKY